MNPIRRKILNTVGRVLALWDKTWLANHLQGNYNTIHSQRYAHRLRNHTLLICGKITIKGDSYITINDYTRFENGCIVTAWDKSPDGEILKPNIQIGTACSFGEYNHITCVNEIIIGNNVLTGRWVTITDNSHGDSEFETLMIAPIMRPTISKGRLIEAIYIPGAGVGTYAAGSIGPEHDGFTLQIAKRVFLRTVIDLYGKRLNSDGERFTCYSVPGAVRYHTTVICRSDGTRCADKCITLLFTGFSIADIEPISAVLRLPSIRVRCLTAACYHS